MKYRTKFLCFLVLVNSLVIKAQVESIDLPKGNDEMKIRTTTTFFSIYIDAKDKVYLEKELINVYAIAKKLSYLSYKLPDWLRPSVKIHLYIDKNANYSTLDIIKTQLASAHFQQLYYKTNTIEDKDILRGISWINHQSFFKFKRLEKVLTDKEIEKNNRLNDSLRKLGELNVIPPPPPPMPNWYFDNLHKIYSDNQEAIDEALEEQSYTCTLLTNKGFKTDTDIVTMENTEKLQELFSSFNIVFVKFDKDLIYSNYFKAIKAFKEIDTTNRGFLVELSNEIVEIHKTSEINLCN